MGQNGKRSPLFVESPSGVLILDRQGSVTDVNPAGCKGFSRRKEYLVGRRLLQWVIPGDQAQCEAALDRVLRGERADWRCRIRRGDGIARLQQFHGSPLHREGGVQGVLLFLNGLGEGREGRPETPQLQTLLENLPGQFVVVLDKRGVIRYSSGLGRTHFLDGFSVLGTPFRDLLGNQREGEENLDDLLKTVCGGGNWGGVQWHRRRDGVSFPVEIFSTPHLDPKTGHVLGVLVVGRDLSPLRDWREKAQDVEPMAQIGALTSQISKEISKSLDGLEEGVREGGEGSPKDHFQIEKEIDQLRRLLEGIEEFGNRGRVRKESLSLPELTQVALERAVGRMGPLGIQPTLEVPPNLPAVFADRRQLERTLDLLVENALDALEVTPSPMLKAELKNGPDGVILRMTNSGSSLSAEGLVEVFDPFISEKEGHPGLGLAIARAMIRAQDGRIWAEVPQEGFLTLAVELPRDAPDRVRSFRHTPLDLTRARSILVVDDEESIRIALRSFLEKVGFEVKEAWSGRSALAALTSGQLPDLLLTDLKMSDGSGYWFLEEISKDYPHLVEKTVIITGDADHEAATELAESTGCPLVRKPFELPELLEILDEISLQD